MTRSKIEWKRMLVELAVIFAGVTLSFLADDWRDYRSDRDAGRVVLEQILADSEGDEADIMASAAPLLVQDENAAPLLTRWDESLDSDSVAERLEPFNDGEPYAGQQAAFSALKSAGRLDLVRDGELRARTLGTTRQAKRPLRRKWRSTFGNGPSSMTSSRPMCGGRHR